MASKLGSVSRLLRIQSSRIGLRWYAVESGSGGAKPPIVPTPAAAPKVAPKPAPKPAASPATPTPAASPLTAAGVPTSPQESGQTDNTKYQVPEYYAYNEYSFYDIDKEMSPHRLPQPSSM